MSKHKTRPWTKRRWIKHPLHGRGVDGGADGDEASGPTSRLLRIGLAVLRLITERVPLARRRGFARVTDRLARASERVGHLRDEVRKKLDSVTAVIARRGPSTTA